MLEIGNSHDIWYDDEGLFAPGLTVATIGPHRRVPFPVFILGVDGESSTDATISVAELASMVRDMEAVR